MMSWIRPSSREMYVFWNERTRHIRPDWKIKRLERIGQDVLYVMDRKHLLWGSFDADDGARAFALLFVSKGTIEDRFESSLASIFLLEILGLARSSQEKESIARSLSFFHPHRKEESSYVHPGGIHIKAKQYESLFYALTVQFWVRTSLDSMV